MCLCRVTLSTPTIFKKFPVLMILPFDISNIVCFLLASDQSSSTRYDYIYILQSRLFSTQAWGLEPMVSALEQEECHTVRAILS